MVCLATQLHATAAHAADAERLPLLMLKQWYFFCWLALTASINHCHYDDALYHADASHAGRLYVGVHIMSRSEQGQAIN